MSKENTNEEVFVKIEKGKLDNILNRLETLEKEVSGVNDLKPVAKNTARMRMIDGKIVIGFNGKNWTKYNEKERKEEMWAELVLIDKNAKTSNKKVNYEDFLEQSEVITVDILKQEVRQERKVQGETEVKEVVDYKTVGTGDYVPVETVTPIVEATVDLPEIGKYKLSIDSLNI